LSSQGGSRLTQPALGPARGFFAPGYAPVARCFAGLLEREEIGAAVSIYVRGEHVVDLHGGLADVKEQRPWQKDTRIVVFSATKGLMAMATHLLADRGLLEWDAPVAKYWPEFAANGKAGITVRTLLNHRAGLPYLDTPLRLDDFLAPTHPAHVCAALESQRPAWTPGTDQGYHATTYGMYARELFARIAQEPVGPFLRRELFEPLGSDAFMGTPASEDPKFATLYNPSLGSRLRKMLATAITDPDSNEVRILKGTLKRNSIGQKAYRNPKTKGGVFAYNSLPVRRAALAWASATASADGLARAYLPFAGDGSVEGRRYFGAESLEPLHRRQGWSECDRVLQKPQGWSQGFLKEQRKYFSPNPESFGHAGLGGALGWCDPVEGVAFGYVLNQLDWRVRSGRAVALCNALYECAPLFAGSRRAAE
jgi:CubicO group peptidase (beta-lactamase class C family)